MNAFPRPESCRFQLAGGKNFCTVDPAESTSVDHVITVFLFNSDLFSDRMRDEDCTDYKLKVFTGRRKLQNINQKVFVSAAGFMITLGSPKMQAYG